MQISTEIEAWPRMRSFAIAGRTFHDARVLTVCIEADGLVGRGEASGVYYRGETVEAMAQTIGALDLGGARLTRTALATRLPAGGARNALDCALWDLEAKQAKAPVWRLAGLPEPRPLLTTLTLGADTPGRMAELASTFTHARALKLKLLGDGEDARRVAAVRAVCPDVWLGIDANQAFSRQSFAALLPLLLESEVKLVEQPFACERDADLEDLNCPVPIIADESVQDRAGLAALVGRFDGVNIKLDKCGGLTEALAMAAEARRLGLGLMVGCMTSTSLAMAPGWMLGQICDYIDLDGPLDLAVDRNPAASYDGGLVSCPESLWGYPCCGGDAHRG
jgi:L-alanine-DL-glutamate epimerase-like enolase superfamily enzyme